LLTLKLELPKTESGSIPEATITLRIILPESKIEISVPESVE
jgi:hypothetical protein